MTTLYIIGNGFDLWHGLPTSYSNFNDFAKDTLEEFENYYLLNFSHTDPWHDFENALGAFSWSKFYDAHNEVDACDENFRPSFVLALEDDLDEQADQHIEAIRNCFQEWVFSIDTTTIEKKLNLCKGSIFVTFNYTSTLQSIYGIDKDRVLHIHGQAEKYDNLIFGHGETMDEEPELDENGDSNRTMFSDAEGSAKYPFYALQKPVEEILPKLQTFMENKEYIDEIVIIGHSLNKIDLPYFRLLTKRFPNSTWKVCLYNQDEKDNLIEALTTCAIPRSKIHTIGYEDLVI